MTRDESIIELGLWLRTTPGRYLLDWEQRRFDDAVTDAFGFHALQLGLPGIDALRANRMPHRWVANDSLVIPELDPLPPLASDSSISTLLPDSRVALACDFRALPFAADSIDLVVLPHALELACDPHQTLREVERVLRPEGRVVVAGFNPASLWGLRQRLGRARLGIGIGRQGLYLPRAGEFIGYWRLRDWLRLLGFELESGQFGCYRPPASTAPWLDRFAWMDRVGERWWPVLGAVYTLVAVKRVRAMRLVGLLRRDTPKPRTAAAVATQRIETAETE
jgi:hypothetical protein